MMLVPSKVDIITAGATGAETPMPDHEGLGILTREAQRHSKLLCLFAVSS